MVTSNINTTILCGCGVRKHCHLNLSFSAWVRINSMVRIRIFSLTLSNRRNSGHFSSLWRSFRRWLRSLSSFFDNCWIAVVLIGVNCIS